MFINVRRESISSLFFHNRIDGFLGYRVHGVAQGSVIKPLLLITYLLHGIGTAKRCITAEPQRTLILFSAYKSLDKVE